MKTARDMLPATAPEIAAAFGITVRAANSRLQSLAARGLARRTAQAVIDTGRTRGRYPHIWERIR